jgi:hypothetical protein
MEIRIEISNSIVESCRLLPTISSNYVDQGSDPIIVNNGAFLHIEVNFLPLSRENRVIQEFTESCCEKGADYLIGPAYVYYAYCKWVTANGHGCKSEDELETDLKLLGITKKYIDGRSYWVGITLKPEIKTFS